MTANKGVKNAGAKKAVKKRGATIKNVLGQPYSRYWYVYFNESRLILYLIHDNFSDARPQLNDDNTAKFIQLLSESKDSCPTLFTTKKSTEKYAYQ